MSDIDTALDLLRSANPVVDTGVLDSDELAASVAACERVMVDVHPSRHAGTPVLPVPEITPSRRPAPTLRPLVVVAATFAVVVMTVVAIAFVGRSTAPPAAPNTAVPLTVPTTGAPAPDGVVVRYEVAVAAGLVYWTDGATTFTVDVVYPIDAQGSLPVVVAFPAYIAGTKDLTTAREMAQRGAVAFAPMTVPRGDRSPEDYIDGMDFDRGACAVGFAQATAAEYGGDPRRTTVVGAGGGDHHALWSALGLVRDDVCDVPILHPPTGLVAGVPQWLFELEYWDAAVVDPESNARDTLDRFWNADRWQPAADLRVHLWSTPYAGNDRGIDEPIADDSWIRLRDTTGTLVDDLEALGAFRDGVIGHNDNARLMYLRMRRAGIPATLAESDSTAFNPTPSQYDRIWSIVSHD